MNISELIEALQRLKEKHGDVPVYHHDHEGYIEIDEPVFRTVSVRVGFGRDRQYRDIDAIDLR